MISVLELTSAITGKGILIVLDRIQYVFPGDDSGTLINFGIDHTIRVKEDYPQVLAAVLRLRR